MQKIITYIYKVGRRTLIFLGYVIDHIATITIIYCNNVHFKKIRTNGIPYVSVARGGSFSLGDNFIMNNNIQGNPIGRVQRCSFVVNRDAVLVIGDNVGISSTAIVAHKEIRIGNNVKIGGGVCIYDTDFHSIDASIRNDKKMDHKFENKQRVTIGDNVFIGAHSTILKGVNLGENSVIGACSVITKNIPANEIWAGNPAKIIKKIG